MTVEALDWAPYTPRSRLPAVVALGPGKNSDIIGTAVGTGTAQTPNRCGSEYVVAKEKPHT